jgi:hypothetical protein
MSRLSSRLVKVVAIAVLLYASLAPSEVSAVSDCECTWNQECVDGTDCRREPVGSFCCVWDGGGWVMDGPFI